MTEVITQALLGADDETLRNAVRHANPMVLLGLIYHATGDASLDTVPTVVVPAGLGSMNIVADAHQVDRVQNLALQLLADYRDGRRTPPSPQSDDRVLHAMTLTAGETVPEDEFGLHRDVLAFDSTPHGWGDGPDNKGDVDFNVIVIGAGLAGINAAVQLKASGIEFVVLDRNAGPGGTWFNNRYPGARVDWPSRLYSHSFGVDYPFAHGFAPRAENEAYLQWCTERYSLDAHMHFGVQVQMLRWIDADGCWEVVSRESDGTKRTRRARAIISAIGLLERPNIPALPGLDTFSGPVFHTSRFDPETPLEGKRVAVVGTGASGLQMVPDLAPLVDQLTIFQRSPAWVIQMPGYRDPLPDAARWLDANVPFYTNWSRFLIGWALGDYRLLKIFEVDETWPDYPISVNADNQAARERALEYLQTKLKDRPDLLAKCTPNYPIFANRPVLDNGWFDTLLHDKVELVTDKIVEITPDGIRTADGVDHPADLIVMATGFNPNDYFAEIDIVGRNGRHISDIWAETGPRAYWGVAVPHLPNMFILYGPNANPRNLGPVQYGEWAMDYILEVFKMIVQNKWQSVELREDAYENFNAEVIARCQQLVSVNAATTHSSYYITRPGQSAVQSPWTSAEVWRAFSKVDLDHYLINPAPELQGIPPGAILPVAASECSK